MIAKKIIYRFAGWKKNAFNRKNCRRQNSNSSSNFFLASRKQTCRKNTIKDFIPIGCECPNNASGSKPGEKVIPVRFVFTLIELLLVVAIIAILVSILLPALKKARDSAAKIKCASNIKQIGLVSHMYLNDYDGYYVPNRFNAVAGYPYALEILNAYIKIPSFWTNDYNKAGVFWCPKDAFRTKTGFPTLSYANNAYLGYNWTTKFYAKLSGCRRPERIIYFADGFQPNGNNCSFSINTWPFKTTASAPPDANGIDFRHSNQCLTFILGGHVDTRHYKDLAGKIREIYEYP